MTSQDKIIAQINIQNPSAPYPFSTSNIAFATPEDDVEAGWNTKLAVSAVEGGGYDGTVEVYYHRIDLSELGADIGLSSEAPFTNQTFLDALNAVKATDILLTDLETFTLPTQTTGVVLTVVLTALSTSLGWRGTNTISFVVGLPATADALHTLLNVTMPAEGYL